MDVPRGCECSGGNCRIHDENRPAITAPIAFLIKRDGKLLSVCTRCRLIGDETVSLLVSAADEVGPYLEYDKLGATVLAMLIGEKHQGERKTSN